MKRKCVTLFACCVLVLALFPEILIGGQIDPDAYERAERIRGRFQSLALNMVDRGGWIEKTPRYWYRKSVEGGFEFAVVDAEALSKRAAFDHTRLAEALSKITGETLDPKNLPFRALRFTGNESELRIEVGEWAYACDLESYACRRVGPARRWGRGGFSMWERGPAPEASSSESMASPDGRWEAFIKNYNVYLRSKDKGDEIALSRDGTEGDYYTFASLAWSPDSRKLAGFRLKRGYHRIIHYVESSPRDQLQPKYHQMEYAKPGDALDVDQPVLFLVESRKRLDINNALFPDPYDLSNPEWRKDSGAFTFEYNQRGHQVFRIIEVDAASGTPRSVVSEESDTFFCYSDKKFRFDIEDGEEVIWMSERDGWNHLYLYDGASGTVKHRITEGEWVVRGVDKVDVENRRIYFQASGMIPGRDPYFVNGYRIDFDGSGLTALTEGEGHHSLSYSQDMGYFIDTWSRVDQAPVTELRRTSDRELLMQVEKTDMAALTAAGWRAPEVFVSKARDGRTDIWGIINRPLDFDPSRKYPVIEYIYAGPQGSFVPKTFSPFNRMQGLAEMGFIVVQIDGMGTNHRSKSFHDVCWKNLGDAGFPDRILWHQAVAAEYGHYDLTRVGIYGNSAGGQNALGGLLFHPEFYHAGVSSCGCHDNRMDKIWWNEQWMGWPLGPDYAASSNVDNAHLLKGKLLLIVGEMDTNVDPASTMQVVDALIRADKVFDLLVIPGGSHGMGGAYGQRKMIDFFVRNLRGERTPEWNRLERKN